MNIFCLLTFPEVIEMEYCVEMGYNWCRGVMVITTTQLHLIIHELRFFTCSNAAVGL